MTAEDKDEIDNLSKYQLADYVKNVLMAMGTDGQQDNDLYIYIRQRFVNTIEYKPYIPNWVITNRTVKEFWSFIKTKFSTYAERRNFISSEFAPLLNSLEFGDYQPMTTYVKFDEAHIHEQWEKALERKTNDPEGAITIARTLIESILKHILTERGKEYTETMDISELYKETAKTLNLAPEQHYEPIFKQILGGASGIISGLGTLRNKLGDAHGGNKDKAKPTERHSELAVNMSGSMAIFLYKTHVEQKDKK